MKLLVCGSRSWRDAAAIKECLAHAKPDLVIHGGAAGADTLAGEAAKALGIPVCVFPANWYYYGKSAGPLRNQLMLDFGKPDQVVAFWDGLSRGTNDMMMQARQAGLPVKVIRPKEVT